MSCCWKGRWVHRPGPRRRWREHGDMVRDDGDRDEGRRSRSSMKTSPGRWRRRGRGAEAASRPVRPVRYEAAFRVIGRYMDDPEAERRLLLRAGRRVRPPTADERPGGVVGTYSPSSRVRTSTRWSRAGQACATLTSGPRHEPDCDQSQPASHRTGGRPMRSQDGRGRVGDHPRGAHRHPARCPRRTVRLAQGHRGNDEELLELDQEGA